MQAFSNYYVDYETGFIINQKHEVELPSCYDHWIYLIKNLEVLIETCSLYEYVNKMPVISIESMKSCEQLFYCHSILAFATSIFVWHRKSEEIPKILPKSLSIPLRAISNKLGMMPILCHSNMVLFNTIIDTTKDYLEIKIKINTNNNWNIFQRETARIELCFSPIIRAIQNLNVCILNENPDGVITNLRVITKTLHSMKDVLKNFNEMNPDYFHRQMRPFLVGWSGDSFIHEGGLLYENENGSTTAIECIGASAAQSPTFQVLDSLFKIKHSTDSQKFFDSMKLYMIKEHRDFIDDVGKFINLDIFMKNNSTHSGLTEMYNETIKAISCYRTNHMQIVTKFIINPSKKMRKEEINSKFLQERGTGGQDLIKFLKEVRDDTVNKEIH